MVSLNQHQHVSNEKNLYLKITCPENRIYFEYIEMHYIPNFIKPYDNTVRNRYKFYLKKFLITCL